MSTKEKLLRIGISLVIVLVIIGLQRLIIPGLNKESLRYLTELVNHSKVTLSTFQKLKLFPFGITPLFSATAITLFFFGLFPKINKTPISELRRKIARPTIFFLIIIVFLQSFFISQSISNVEFEGGGLIGLPRAQFIPLYLFSVMGAFFLLLSILRAARLRGIVSGLTLFLLFDMGGKLFFSLAFTLFSSEVISGKKHPTIIGTCIVTAIITALVLIRKRVPLKKEGTSLTYKLPIRLNMLGALPILSMSLPFAFISLIHLLGQKNDVFASINIYTTEGFTRFQFPIILGTIVLSMLLLFYFNYPMKYIENILKKYDVEIDKPKTNLKNLLLPFALANGGFILSLYFLQQFFYKREEYPVIIGVLPLFLVIVLSVKLIKSIIKPVILRKEKETTFLEFDTVLEAELLCHDLQSRGIKSRVINSRFLEYTGSEAFWEIARPRFIAASANPFLENGSVTVVVHNDDYDTALSYWEEFNSSGQVAP